MRIDKIERESPGDDIVDKGFVAQLFQNIGPEHEHEFSAPRYATGGGGKRETVKQFGMIERELLADHAAHRVSHEMGFLDAGRFEESRDVVGHHFYGVRAVGLIGRADAAVIDHKHLVALR